MLKTKFRTFRDLDGNWFCVKKEHVIAAEVTVDGGKTLLTLHLSNGEKFTKSFSLKFRNTGVITCQDILGVPENERNEKLDLI